MDELIEGIKNQNPRFDPIQQYKIIKKFIEEKEDLDKEDLKKLTVASIFDNTWCKKFEDRNCRGCPVYEFENWSCMDSPDHPLYSEIYHV